jgi:hypothetical protein
MERWPVEPLRLFYEVVEKDQVELIHAESDDKEN